MFNRHHNVFKKIYKLKQTVNELNDEIETEQQNDLEKWIQKQEKSDEEFYLRIEKVEEKSAEQQEKMDSDKIEQRSAMDSLSSEMRQYVSTELTKFGHDMLDELDAVRADFKDLEKSMQTQNASGDTTISDIIIEETNPWIANNESSMEAFDSDSFKISIEALEKSVAGFKEEFPTVQSALRLLTEELAAAKLEQKEKINALMKAHEQEIELFRKDIISQVKDILDANKITHEAELNSIYKEQWVMKNAHKQEIEALRNQMLAEINKPKEAASPSTSSSHVAKTQSPAKPRRVYHIRAAIVGDWKLVGSRNINKFLATNNGYKHEVRTENMRFHVADNKLTSYYFNGEGYQKLKMKMLGTADSTRNHWRIEENRIESVDFNGFSKKASATETSTRYMANGQLVVVNEMGGCVCTRFYQKIK